MSDDQGKAEAELVRRHQRADGSVHHPGPPAFIRSDNGPEFVAEAVRDWISAVGAKTAYIEVDLVQMKRLELQARQIRTGTDKKPHPVPNVTRSSSTSPVMLMKFDTGL